ncbi:hypothetical protein LTS17_001007 [Exophiala oligosperma]
MFQQVDGEEKGNTMVTSALLRRALSRPEPALDVDKHATNYSKLPLTSNEHHYRPLATRWQILAVILFGLLSSVAVLEVGLEKGVKYGASLNHQPSTKRHHVEDFDTLKAAAVPDGIKMPATSTYTSRPMRPPHPWSLPGTDSTPRSLIGSRKTLTFLHSNSTANSYESESTSPSVVTTTATVTVTPSIDCGITGIIATSSTTTVFQTTTITPGSSPTYNSSHSDRSSSVMLVERGASWEDITKSMTAMAITTTAPSSADPSTVTVEETITLTGACAAAADDYIFTTTVLQTIIARDLPLEPSDMAGDDCGTSSVDSIRSSELPIPTTSELTTATVLVYCAGPPVITTRTTTKTEQTTLGMVVASIDTSATASNSGRASSISPNANATTPEIPLTESCDTLAPSPLSADVTLTTTVAAQPQYVYYVTKTEMQTILAPALVRRSTDHASISNSLSTPAGSSLPASELDSSLSTSTSTTMPVVTVKPDRQRPNEVDLGIAITPLQHFRAIYIPTLTAVTFKLLWSTVFASTRMMEPFYLLARKGGASAKMTLNADYLTSSVSPHKLRTLFRESPVVILASLAYLVFSILPALATQASTIRASSICLRPDGMQVHCGPKWELNVTYAKALQGLLSAVAFMIGVIIWLSARRPSGVFSNPSSIAAMASLLNNDAFVQDLTANHSDKQSTLASTLCERRYALSSHFTPDGSIRYGMGEVVDDSVEQQHPSPEEETTEQSSVDRKKVGGLLSRLKTLKPFILETALFLAQIALLCVLFSYYFIDANDAFNRFFLSNPLRRFILTFSASLLDARWKQLEREVRIMTPYRRLHAGSASPSNTILVTQNGTAITSIAPALWRRNLFHAFVATVATLSDLLIIFIGGVPFSSAQVLKDYYMCIQVSITILCLMVATVPAIIVWRVQNSRMKMPRGPDTLLAVWTMLCNQGNGICEETRGMEKMPARDRDRIIVQRGSRYWAGWITTQTSHSSSKVGRMYVVEKTSGSMSSHE